MSERDLNVAGSTLPTANPPGPTTAVATGFELATPPSPAIAKPTAKIGKLKRKL
jgi:hypothetical protein